ncbi:MAG TPA: hypothetical protein VH852_05100 [Hyphomicrobium sp.]|jgi:glucose uptake protein GlcU
MRAGKNVAQERALAVPGDAAYRLIGLTIIAVVPALFWTAIVALIGAAVGHPQSVVTLATIGAAIATFLFTVVSALFGRAS